MNNVLLTPLRRIPTPGGDVMHALKDIDPGFGGFGEAYFTSVSADVRKGWKRHLRMTMNLVVPHGAVRFVVRGDEANSPAQIYDLSPNDAASYQRLTVPPGWWVAFTGLTTELNLILNIASIRHDPDEAETRPISFFSWPDDLKGDECV